MTYMAFLRGINVGKSNRIKMVDLKKVFEEMGCGSVQTYIQSGNVLFASDDAEDGLSKKIEEAIQTSFGFSSPVILRTVDELQDILAGCPFTSEEMAAAEASTDAECLYVSLLERAPTEKEIENLPPRRLDGDQYHIIGKEMYMLFHQSIRDSKLAVGLQKLSIPATVRNWKTLTKMLQLYRQRE